MLLLAITINTFAQQYGPQRTAPETQDGDMSIHSDYTQAAAITL